MEKLLFPLAFISFLLLAPAPGSCGGPCGILFTSMSQDRGAPGDEFEMYGTWGDSQGSKAPRINMGAAHPLEVVSWSDKSIRVKIPRGLPPGTYKVGVYCETGSARMYSSVWKDFKVTAGDPYRAAALISTSGGAPLAMPAAGTAPAPSAAGGKKELSGQALGLFKRTWKTKGLALKKKAWLSSFRLTVLADKEVDPRIPGQLIQAINRQLSELGAKKLRAVPAAAGFPGGLAKCVRGKVLDETCFGSEIKELRGTSREYGNSMLVIVTNAAIGRLPKTTAPGVMAGPPAGTASYGDGWILMSDFWHYWNREDKPGFKNPEGFEEHARAHTVKHELFHMLGLPHHEQLPNPGFPKPKLCTECSHRGAGGHAASPHSECIMFCGSGDDEWAHSRTFGKGFGFCEKCLTAAKAVVEGIEE